LNGISCEQVVTAGETAPKPDYWMFAGDDAEQLTRDPVVRHLVEQHALRKQFPAKHTFSMTNPIEDGRILILATCKCGHQIKFGAGDQIRVDAAIEAHWPRHDFDGPLIGGRGEPIVPEVLPGSKKRKRKNIADDAPRIPRLEPAPTSAPNPSGAGSPPSEAGGQPSASAPAPVLASSPGAGGLSPEEIERRDALRAVARGESVDWSILRGLVGDGLAHATTTQLLITGGPSVAGIARKQQRGCFN
jgi:hypothetical protein